MALDLDGLRCFEAAASTLRFRTAAALVHLSPAAFSDRVRRLEEALGAPLFSRTTRRVALTETGERLLPWAKNALAAIQEVQSIAEGPGRPSPYELVIGTRYELGVSWLCPALEPLSRANPARTLHLFNGDTPDLLRRLEHGQLDAVVASMRLTSPRLRYATLHAEEYALVSAPPRRGELPLRRRADAAAFTLLDVAADLPLFRYFLDALPNAEPWPFARIEYLGGIGNIRRRLLDGGRRVAVLPRYFIEKDLAAGRLARRLGKVRLRSDAFRLVWRAGHPREPALVTLAAELRQLPLR